MLRKIIHSVMRFLYRRFFRLEIIGLENIPVQGGAILATNHISLLDAPLIFTVVERQDLTGLVADKHKSNLLIACLVEAVKGIWIDRERADLNALRTALNYLQAGGMLGIAPEGTRSKSGSMQPAKSGVAYLAIKAGVPIIPIAVSGTDRAVQGLLHFKRMPLRIAFGPPFTLPALDRRDRDASLERHTLYIMQQIAALLPEGYRGVYADEKELLHQD